MIFDVFSTPPQAVNEIGTKFWLDKSTTDYAQKGKGLTNCKVVYIEDVKGYQTRLILVNNEPIYENQSLEAICCRIDIIALNKEFRDESSSKLRGE